jgi:hypothetical protein
MALPRHVKEIILKDYVKRLAELAGAGFLAGAGAHVAEHGLDYSAAGLKGLAVAGALAAYGVLVKRLGDKDRPTVK